MNDIILDASAIIAVMKQESGADRVAAVAGGAVVSALVAAEVVAWMAMGSRPLDEVDAMFNDFDLRIESFDRARAIAAGFLVTKTKRRGLSLADRACLALAVELGLPVMTGDRAWRAVGPSLGVEVRLFR